MRIIQSFLAFFFLSSFAAHAQEQPAAKPKPAYHAIGYVGVLDGEKSSTLQLQMVNGVGYKTWFAGIGAGLDYYSIRTIPLTAYVEKTFSNRVPIFLYASSGVHFVWPRKEQDTEPFGYKTEYNKGLFYDAGLGYRFDMARKASIRMTIGFSEKQIEETREQAYIWGPPGSNPWKEVYDYRLQRLSIKAGFQF